MTRIVALPEFKVIKLSGEQSHSFLQGQVTNDVTKLKDVEWQAGAHCNAKGKAWSNFIAFEKQDELFLVLTEQSAAQSLAELNKYGVFSKTEITDDSSHWHIYGSNTKIDVQNGRSIELASDHYLVMSESPLETTDTNNEAWWFDEVLSGRAHLFEGTIGEFVPQMMNLQALDYISFNKGCYMGQEMIARMRYLGKNKRALYLAKIDDEVSLDAGQDVFVAMNGNRRAKGKVINSATFNGNTAFQVIMPNDTDLTEIIYIDAESDKQARLLPLPYSLEQN